MLFTYISVVINSSERKDERGGYDDGRKYVKKPWIGGFVHGSCVGKFELIFMAGVRTAFLSEYIQYGFRDQRVDPSVKPFLSGIDPSTR